MAYFNLLVTHETRAQEKRVSLIPLDAKRLIAAGHRVFVEHHAGVAAGFSDQDYQQIGAQVRYLQGEQLASYQALLHDIDLVVRAKRPTRTREILENQAMQAGTRMIGALDPLEKHAHHLEEYHRAGIVAYSIDQLTLATDDPMNVLAQMSRLAGRLALQDACRQCRRLPQKVVIIGFGTVGQAALQAALAQNLPTTVIVSRAEQAAVVNGLNAAADILERSLALSQQQAFIKNHLLDADIVITSARQANQPAPLLIPASTLQQMQPGAVIVDMALSEGGNVEGAVHDETHCLGNHIIVTNQSGYPKALPAEASRLWSTASRLVIEKLAGEDALDLSPLMRHCEVIEAK